MCFYNTTRLRKTNAASFKSRIRCQSLKNLEHLFCPCRIETYTVI